MCPAAFERDSETITNKHNHILGRPQEYLGQLVEVAARHLPIHRCVSEGREVGRRKDV